jgi:hypothetical protein
LPVTELDRHGDDPDHHGAGTATSAAAAISIPNRSPLLIRRSRDDFERCGWHFAAE